MSPILLIPGLACTAELFAPQIPALWPRGPVTIASTLSGETMAEIAAAILHEAPPRFALGGVSMGGYVSLEILRQGPERVLKLALIDTTARPDTPEMSRLRRASVAQARSGGFEPVLRQSTPNLLHPDHRADAALIETHVRMGLSVGVEAFARQQAAIIGRIDSRPHLPAITVPTTVMVGDRDLLTPPDRAEEMAAAIPGARLVVIADSGHASTLEQPDAVNRALLDWLDA
ncbi:alpha/beta fold hydrolase [Brevundimonas sp. PAMC22021]|uniref:alpha/beta fold hydrolase n=1 Tax=Brevundimonas sp. PAMC22021 TaxID=2861285 RepID=UPI001C628454|nr:alpha/beta fold hydrolase [Brevundimonas sp. PAMC22021]QYF87567.1 alpha/beta hydrolase [Brevundimonas sp. PAMC22021]